MERKLAAILAADVAGYSRLMELDEEGTLRALRGHREVVDRLVAAHRGRVFNSAGDSIVVEFGSIVEAVMAAVEIQREMAQRNEPLPADKRIAFRIGLNIGDVMAEGDNLFGDGINVAARVQAIAERGGIAMTGAAAEQVRDRVPELALDDLGEQHFRNIARPIRCHRVRLDGKVGGAAARGVEPSALRQEIQFCTTGDGVRIAYASVGDGPPLVKPANWMTHLEFDWQSPVWRHWIRDLARDHRLVRYDERANGLSDWTAEDVSFEAFVQDFEAVIDAAGLERFPILGVSQGCSIGAAYAARHPERVSGLVLYGGYARGWALRGGTGGAALRSALVPLIEHGWGRDNPAFRQMFTTLFIPDATIEQMHWFNDLQRMTVSPANALRLHHAFGQIDVRPILPQVRVPTLVLHCRGDGVVPFEEGRLLAAGIPHARFVPLEGRNHIILETEPAWQRFLAEARAFLSACA